MGGRDFHRVFLLGMAMTAAGILTDGTAAWGRELPTESGEIFAMDTYMSVSATGEKALAWWDQHRDSFDAILVEADGSITVTAGLEGRFSSELPFETVS